MRPALSDPEEQRMKCITAVLNGLNDLRQCQYISRSVRRSGHGLRAWLGEPFRLRADEGPQNDGRQCDFIDVSDSFVPTASSGSKGGEEVLIRSCSVEAPGANGRVQLLPDKGDAGVLVLLRVFSRALATDPVHTVEFDQSPHQLAEGYFADYGRVSNTRRPVRFVNSRVEERLVKLLPGQTYSFYADEPEARVLGLTVHRGCRNIYELKNIGDRISFSKVGTEPLVVPAFDWHSLANELGVALLFAVIGIICGALCTPVAAVKTPFLLSGFAGGLAVFALIQAIRFGFHRYTAPPSQARSF